MVNCSVTKAKLTHEVNVPDEIKKHPDLGKEMTRGRYCNWLALCVSWARRAQPHYNGKDPLTNDQVGLLIQLVESILEGWPENYRVRDDLPDEEILNPPPLFLTHLKEVRAPAPKKTAEPATALKAVKSTLPRVPASEGSSAAAPKAVEKIPYSKMIPHLTNICVFVPAGKDATSTVPQVDCYKMDTLWTFLFEGLCKDDAEKEHGLTVQQHADGWVTVKRAKDSRQNEYLSQKLGKPFKGAAVLFDMADSARSQCKRRVSGAKWEALFPRAEAGALPTTDRFTEYHGGKAAVKAKAAAVAQDVTVVVAPKKAPRRKKNADEAVPMAVSTPV